MNGSLEFEDRIIYILGKYIITSRNIQFNIRNIIGYSNPGLTSI